MEIDPDNYGAYYRLASIHYKAFIRPTEKLNHDLIVKTGDFEKDSIDFAEVLEFQKFNNANSVIKKAPEKALDYFKRLWQLDDKDHRLLYYPIQQLGCYLKVDVSQFDLGQSNNYFPEWQFTQLRKNWKCDYTIDYLFEIGSSMSWAENLGRYLIHLNEPKLYQSNRFAYRFTWFRSFDQPIVIRLEEADGKYYIVWKIGKGAGGYSSKVIANQGKRKVSEKQWQIFENLVDHIVYVNFRNYQSMTSTDGASWTFEHNSPGYFRAVETQHPDTNLYRACMYLLKLAKIEIDELRVY